MKLEDCPKQNECSNKLPEFREYARQKYPKELDEGLITIIEDLIERRRASNRNNKAN